MRWQEFLKTAQRLLTSNTEGDLRSAVSRAYYAVFHSFREWLKQFGVDIGIGGSAHSNLYFGLNNCGDPDVGRIADRIDALRSERVKSDYDLVIRVLPTTANNCVSDAQTIISDFQALLTSRSAQVIADGAKKHLKSIGRVP